MQLLLQNAVLLDEIVDDMRLMTIDPAGEGGEEQLKAEDVRHDSVIVPVRRKVVTRAAAVRSSIRIPGARTESTSRSRRNVTGEERASVGVAPAVFIPFDSPAMCWTSDLAFDP